MSGTKKAIAGGTAVVLAAGLFFAADRFAKTELAQQADRVARPKVTNTRPAADESAVSPVTGIAADITLPSGAGVDPATLETGISLIRMRDGAVIPSHKNTSGSGDMLMLKPTEQLETGTQYKFVVSQNLKDASGASFDPYSITFTTAQTFALTSFPVVFEKVEMKGTAQEQDAYTSLAMGPDGLLYAGTFAGVILRYHIADDGTLEPRAPLMNVIESNGGPRLVTGIAFDPASTAENPILWVNHGQMAVTPEGRLEGADDWTGKLSRLKGPDLGVYEDVVVNLPRAFKDHLNFQMTFGPDKAIYFTQGSHTSVGDVDKKWGYRPERRLSGAVLRVDPAKIIQLPLDVKTDEGGSFDPAAEGAPLTIFATGVRSGFDMLFHRNGRLYTGVNGAAGNEGNTPGSPDGKVPAIRDSKETTDDILLKIEKDAYYGHPNPVRGQFALNGANPTDAADPMEVRQYPVGVQPDANYKLPAFVFGKNFSPNGLIEYKKEG
ncbi:MAG TPA: Ig-like domain-containing protein, partial [Tepidisphaeraceae bacterium]